MATQPFCCTFAIPSCFTHLLALIPEPTKHVVVSAHPVTSYAGLLSTFLVSTAMRNFVYPITADPPLPDGVVLRPNGSFRAIVQITKIIPTDKPMNPLEASKTYYVPYGHKDRDRIIVGNTEKLYWVFWKEISKQDAEWCTRPKGSGFNIGDGEHWLALNGTEKLWCDHHKVFWELKAFTRQS